MMDIREWLQNTADREPPDERVEANFPAFLQPQPDVAQPLRRSRQKRKRASSDPPLPAHRHPRERRRPAQRSSSEQVRRTGRDIISISSQSSSSSESRESSVSVRRKAPVETFERRPRRKTKPDRYESKPKRRKKEHQTREKNSESRRRPSHRSGDGARTVGLVQSFHLKNGPKNKGQRLTLKPDASAGIFKHGRASGPVATGGPGLPDLVFNEMRFLRRPKEHQDELPVDDSAKPSKKTRKQLQEEEISAYFSRNIPPHKQASLTKPDAVKIPVAKPSAPQRPLELDGPPKHPVELPEKPFLGFGSRGPPQESIESPHASNSYYTWSESVLAKRSPAPGKPTTTPLKPHNEHSERRRRQLSQVSDAPLSQSKTTARPQQGHLEAKNGNWLQSRRAKAPALIEVYQPPRHANDHRISASHESSEPLPRVVAVHKDSQLEEMDNRWEVGSYHTSDILKISTTIREAGRSPSLYVRENLDKGSEDKENVEPATSTPSSECLRHAFGAVTKPQAIRAPETRERRVRPSDIQPSHNQSKPSSPQRTQSHEKHDTVQSPPAWELPQRGFSRASDANRSQQRPTNRARTVTRPSTSQQWQFQSLERPRPSTRLGRDSEDDMLDVLPNAPLFRPQQSFIPPNSREAEALVRHLESVEHHGTANQTNIDFVEPVVDRYGYVDQRQQISPEQQLEPTSFAPEPFSSHSQQMGEIVSDQQFQSEHYTAGGFQGEETFNNGRREAANPDLANFWRPNILY